MKLYLSDVACNPVGWVQAHRASEVWCLVESGIVREISLGGTPVGAAEQVMRQLAQRRCGSIPVVSFHADIDRLTAYWAGLGFLGQPLADEAESDVEQLRRGSEVSFEQATLGAGACHVMHSIEGNTDE